MEASQIQFQENRAPNRTPRQTTRISDITRIRWTPPWADGSTPNTAGRRARIAASHRTGCRARFGGPWLPTFYVLYRRYVEALVTEINLQAMRGTGHMGERDSIGYLLFGAIGWIAGPSEPSSKRRSARRPTRSGGLTR